MNVVTAGGALVGVVLCAIVLVPWWRKSGKGEGPKGMGAGGRNWRALTPFAGALALGIVCAVAVGGLIGTAAHALARGTSQLGDAGLHVLTGAPSQRVQHPALAHVQAGGAIVVIACLVGFWLVIRKATKQVRRDLGFGLIAGVTMGPAAALTAVAHGMLLPAINALSGQLVGWL